MTLAFQLSPPKSGVKLEILHQCAVTRIDDISGGIELHLQDAVAVSAVFYVHSNS